jgi:hydroxymethylpyrimidine/phosphomethylpyrimidine kinase
LTIAGFDPSSGAGITADLAVFRSEGFFATACITGLTVQSTLGVSRVQPVAATLVSDTLACLADDLPIHGIKIGMLASAENVAAVAEFVGSLSRESVPVVLDPVIRSSSGRDLLSPEGLSSLKRDLLPLVDWVTPNLAELAALTGGSVTSREEMERGARRLAELYPGLGVVVTGGHLDGSVDDLVLTPEGFTVWLAGERIVSQATHGTGCAFSSAMLCGLLSGLVGEQAAQRAKEFVAGAIREATPLGRGKGPMNLAWRTRLQSESVVSYCSKTEQKSSIDR